MAAIQFAIVPDIILPDGSVMTQLYGSQEPRFRTAPPRHQQKDPSCPACQNHPDYECGCGDYQSVDLLEWASEYGYDLDLWQRNWLTDCCGTRPDGRWAAGECLCIACRQNGKNQNLEVRELGGLYLFGESLIIHTAHEFKAAAEHFRRVRDTITSYDSLMRRKSSITTSHGEEAIELKPVSTLIFGPGGKQIRRKVGARLRFLARSRGSGRSFTADCVVYDEAMFLSEDQITAATPTMGAIPNPQVIYTASAGMHDSVQLAMVRRRMIRGDQTLMGAEYSIDPHLDTCPRDETRGRKANHYIICDKHDDRDDPRSWAKANPAFNIRISYENVIREFNSMSDKGFDQEILGVGDWPAEEEAWEVVSEEQWEACSMADPGGTIQPIAFALDIDPDMNIATIASAWERPDPPRKEPTDEQMMLMMQGVTSNGLPLPQQKIIHGSRTVLEIPKNCHREGTAWAVPRLIELVRKWHPAAVVVPKNGPAAAFINELVNARIEVLAAGSADEAAAFSLMVTGIQHKKIIHLGKENAPSMWTAVASADTRVIGDGGKGWCRRTSETDITPIMAPTLAYWGLNKQHRSYDLMKSIGRLG